MKHKAEKEALVILIAAIIMSIKIVVMLALLHRWKTRGEPDV